MASLEFDARLRRIWDSSTDDGAPVDGGPRAPVAADDFLAALAEALADGGTSTDETLYEVGFEWGLAALEALAGSAGASDPLGRWSAGRLMEAWWAAAADAGWGCWRPDFRSWKRGVVLVAAESRGPAADAVSSGLFAAFFSAAARRPLRAQAFAGAAAPRVLIVAASNHPPTADVAAAASALPPLPADLADVDGAPALPEGFWKALATTLSERFGGAAGKVWQRIGAAWGRRWAERFVQDDAAERSLAEASAAWSVAFQEAGLGDVSCDFRLRDRGVVEAFFAPPAASELRTLDAAGCEPLWTSFFGAFFSSLTDQPLAACVGDREQRGLWISLASRIARLPASSAQSPRQALETLLETEA